MNPYLLIGVDLLFTALLVLLALVVIRNRVRFYLESHANGRTVPADIESSAGQDNEKVAAGQENARTWNAEAITQEASKLKRQGFSVEAIAQRLQTSTGEIDMLLAMSEMGKKGQKGKAGNMVFPATPRMPQTFA